MTGVRDSKKEESEKSGNQLMTLLGESRRLGASTTRGFTSGVLVGEPCLYQGAFVVVCVRGLTTLP